MITATIYDVATGEVVRVLQTSSLRQLEANVPEGCDFVLGEFQGDGFYFENGQPIAKPERTGSWAVFDYASKTWTDPRTDADRVAELAAWRASTSLPKVLFLERCMEVGILTPPEAQAGTRQVPETYQAIIAAMSGYERDVAILRWCGATVIERMDPFILTVAAAAGISETILDAIFSGETNVAP